MSETEEKPRKSKSKAASDRVLDPMIVDPDAVQQETFAGTTSDAGTRAEGTEAKDVPADPDNNPDKASDAEDYGFPPAGDVDIATVSTGPGVGEVVPALTVEDWVVLDGADASVPDALDGRRAVVLSVEPNLPYYDPTEWASALFTVRTRDDYGATLTVPVAGIKEVQRRGINPSR
jgi:hypothetical protein